MPLPAGGPTGALGTALERSRQLTLHMYQKELFTETSYKQSIGQLALAPEQLAVFAGKLSLLCCVERQGQGKFCRVITTLSRFYHPAPGLCPLCLPYCHAQPCPLLPCPALPLCTTFHAGVSLPQDCHQRLALQVCLPGETALPGVRTRAQDMCCRATSCRNWQSKYPLPPIKSRASAAAGITALGN